MSSHPRTILCLLLSFLCGSSLPAEDPVPFKINVLEGEGAFNDIRHHTAHAIVIEVRDEQDRPAQGAQVTLTAPFAGPSVRFSNGQRTISGTTNERGLFEEKLIQPSPEEGRFNIKASVTYKGSEGAVVVSQSNTTAGGVVDEGAKHSNKKLLILLGLAGAAATGVGVGMRGGKSSTPAPTPTPTTLSISGVSVGGPR